MQNVKTAIFAETGTQLRVKNGGRKLINGTWSTKWRQSPQISAAISCPKPKSRESELHLYSTLLRDYFDDLARFGHRSQSRRNDRTKVYATLPVGAILSRRAVRNTNPRSYQLPSSVAERKPTQRAVADLGPFRLWEPDRAKRASIEGVVRIWL